MHISEVIRSRRRELGMTQEQVAQRLGVSAPAVNKWERGISYPDITLIPSLARLFETDANTLLSFEPELREEENLANLMGAIVGLIEIALRDGRKDDALECARRAQLAFEALGQPAWMSLMPRLTAVTASGDADEAIELLDAVMTSLHGGRLLGAPGSALPLFGSE